MCYHLSIRSVGSSGNGGGEGGRSRSGDVDGRGRVLSSCTGGRKCAGAVFFISSNVSNADFSHDSFGHVRQVMRRNGVNAVVMGSLSHFNHRRVRNSHLTRVMCPTLNMAFVSVRRGVGASANRKVRVLPFCGVFGR